MAQHVEGHTANQGQVLRAVVLTRSTGIFTELDVQHPMLLIFGAPMTANRGGEPFRVWERAQEIAAFGAGLVADEPGGLDAPKGLEPGPVRFRLQPVNLRTERVAANLDPPVVLSHDFLDRQAPLGDLGVKPQLKGLVRPALQMADWLGTRRALTLAAGTGPMSL